MIQVQRFLRPAGQPLQSAHHEDSFCVGGVVVTHADPVDRLLQITLRGSKVTLFNGLLAHGKIAAVVFGIPSQCLQVVIHRIVGMMLVLLQMGPVKIEFLHRFHIFGPRRNASGVRLLLQAGYGSFIGNQDFTLA